MDITVRQDLIKYIKGWIRFGQSWRKFVVMKTKNPYAVALGSLGGKARAKKLSKKQLSEIGKKGGWPKGKKRKP